MLLVLGNVPITSRSLLGAIRKRPAIRRRHVHRLHTPQRRRALPRHIPCETRIQRVEIQLQHLLSHRGIRRVHAGGVQRRRRRVRRQANIKPRRREGLQQNDKQQLGLSPRDAARVTSFRRLSTRRAAARLRRSSDVAAERRAEQA